MKNQPKRESKKLLCPKAGTATSSPALKTPNQSNMHIVNIMLWKFYTVKPEKSHAAFC